MIEKENIFVDGRWTHPSTDSKLEVISPATEEIIGSVPSASLEDADAAVRAARTSFDSGVWSLLDSTSRARLLRDFAAALRRRSPETTELLALEMGMPYSFGRRLAESASNTIEFFAEAICTSPGPEIRSRLDGGKALVLREPVGVVAAILPWNGPPQSAAKKAGAALAAGCSVVLKPAPEAPLSLYPMMEAAAEVGLPQGVINLLPGGVEVSRHLVSHENVDMVSFTGSERAGREIGAICAGAHRRFVLELGGKSAAIVLDDADLESVAAQLASMVTVNSGQVCMQFSRILVPAASRGVFVERMAKALASIVVGPPDDPKTHMGPLVSQGHRERVESFVEVAKAEGATVAYGGGRPLYLERGFYIEPTLLDSVEPQMTIAREEVFGPVVSVMPYRTVDDAVALANDSQYGLSGGVFTSNERRGLELAKRIRAGTFNINTFSFDTGVPFGGMKASGVGREGGLEGILEFTEIKTVAFQSDSVIGSGDVGQVLASG